ncbi:MAG: FAD-binding oxidoreductase, partial [Acetobacteraceae bacterium]
MAESAAAVQALIGRAFSERRRLRAHGAAWSFSEAPAVPGGWPLATGYANWLFPLPATHVDPAFSGDRDGLVLCQTGISVAELNIYLERRGRSLVTTGASNGQTLVGAVSTGTHGSAIDQPAMQGQVAAIQLLSGPASNLWIEPASEPVTDGRLASALGATVVRDNRLFQAVLVGLGAFGVIHALLIKTAPIFLMRMDRERIAFDDGVKSVMTGGSFDGVKLPGPGGRPYFFQSVVNDHIDKGAAYVTVGHRLAWDPDHALDYAMRDKRGPGYNLAVVVANLLEAFPGLTPPITKAVLSDQLAPIRDRTGSWGQSFNYTTPRAGTVGSSTAVPVDRVIDALDILGRALKKVGKAPVAFACRYAVQSPGLLAFTRFPRTTIIDIDGIDTKATRQMMAAAVDGLTAAGIPHAEHWGKINQMTAVSVRDAYGPDLESWMKARTELLDRQGGAIRPGTAGRPAAPSLNSPDLSFRDDPERRCRRH